VKELEERIRELEDMKRTLQTLARHCHGDDRPECPILENLEQMGGGATSQRKPRDGARRGKRWVRDRFAGVEKGAGNPSQRRFAVSVRRLERWRLFVGDPVPSSADSDVRLTCR
jgi:hypothetical protein